jgi:hypothetical protein
VIGPASRAVGANEVLTLALRDASRSNYQAQKMQPTGIEPATLADLNMKAR